MPEYIKKLALRMPQLASLVPLMESAVNCLARTYHAGGKIIICGNGGSAADSEHMVGELMKGFMLKRPLCEAEIDKLQEAGCPKEISEKLQHAIPAISLVSGVALPTAFANDVDGKLVFAQQVYGLGKAEDSLVAISTSGNSGNVSHAAQVAKAMGMQVIALTGSKTSKIGNLADIALMAPSDSTPIIQEFHIAIYHAICAELEALLFPD